MYKYKIYIRQWVLWLAYSVHVPWTWRSNADIVLVMHRLWSRTLRVPLRKAT
jgi:hypothetical protein